MSGAGACLFCWPLSHLLNKSLLLSLLLFVLALKGLILFKQQTSQ